MLSLAITLKRKDFLKYLILALLLSLLKVSLVSTLLRANVNKRNKIRIQDVASKNNKVVAKLTNQLWVRNNKVPKFNFKQ